VVTVLFPTALFYWAFPAFYTPLCHREQFKAFLTFIAFPCDTFHPDFAFFAFLIFPDPAVLCFFVGGF
jgi:hypothetical protein